jgi:hypothetical protein
MLKENTYNNNNIVLILCFQPLYTFLADKTGYDNVNIGNVWKIADTLLVEVSSG